MPSFSLAVGSGVVLVASRRGVGVLMVALFRALRLVIVLRIIGGVSAPSHRVLGSALVRSVGPAIPRRLVRRPFRGDGPRLTQQGAQRSRGSSCGGMVGPGPGRLPQRRACQGVGLGSASLPTPVDVGRLHSLLMSAGYPGALTEYIVDGFSCGFRLGYGGVLGVSFLSARTPGVSDELCSVMGRKIEREISGAGWRGLLVSPLSV